MNGGMQNEQNIEMKLWSYIDGSVDDEERLRIEGLISSDTNWKRQYLLLLQLRDLLAEKLDIDHPSMRFSKNVMEQIADARIAKASRLYINKTIIVAITFFFLALITGLLIYGFTEVNWSGGNSGIALDFLKIDVSRFLNEQSLNIFLMVNIVLAMILLDRYLSQRSQKNRYRHS
jgi:hypothetical protein